MTRRLRDYSLLVAALAVSQASPESFVDIARSAGLTERMVSGGEKTKKYILETTGGGAAFLDYDNDGWLDIFLVNGSRIERSPNEPEPTNHLYRNKRDGTFRDVTNEAGLARSGWGQGVCAGDYDNDGNVDLFVTYWGQNVLYRNSGKGSFVDATAEAKLKGRPGRWGSGCAFLDYNKDGALDLFVANYVDFDLKTAPIPGSNPLCQYRGLPVNCGPRGLRGESNLLYRNNRDGTFSNASEDSGIGAHGGNFALGVLTGDFDNDGWPDIYVASDTTASLLFHNKHDGTFEEIGVFAGCAYDSDGKETSGMGIAAADYDRDGWLDIIKTNFSDEAPSLYRNNGDGSFVDAALAAGIGRNRKWIGWGVGFFDPDNDGHRDIFLVNGHVYPEVEGAPLGLSFRQPKVLYRNRGDGSFEDTSGSAQAPLATPTAARGCAFGDFDNDGDVDIVVNNMHDIPSLLRVDSKNQNHWLQVRLTGTKSNRSGIGARVYCVAGGKKQLDEVRSGGSYLSQNDFRLHFGIGAARVIELLEIHWPSGTVDRIKDIQSNRLIHIKEGAGIVSKGASLNAK